MKETRYDKINMDGLVHHSIMGDIGKWGPSPHKLTWTEYCRREEALSGKNNDGAPIFMSNQLIHLTKSKNEFGFQTKMLLALRPEDALHIPQLRISEDGIITDWNRSMCDLTGISCAQVVGRAYIDVLNEWIPHLSNEYKQAAVAWVTKKENTDEEKTKKSSSTSSYYTDKGGEDFRRDYLFPLPLPIRYELSLKYTSEGKNRHCDEYIELIVARTDNLTTVYPDFDSCVPQKNILKWFFDTTGWMGGVEFTLRRLQFVPSLQTLCKKLVPDDEHRLNNDGSLSLLSATKSSEESKEGESAVGGKGDTSTTDVYNTISNYIRSCGTIGMRYIREILQGVCKVTRNQYSRQRITNKVFNFSEDWSSHPETSQIHQYVFSALECNRFIKQTVEKGVMKWSFEKEVGSEDKITFQYMSEKGQKEAKFHAMHHTWERFQMLVTPVVAESKHAHSVCGASDSPIILQSTSENPIRSTVLTLKIEGVERSSSYEAEKFKAQATVQVPATFNFFQLHRVVCQTMNCGAYCRRETHEWRVPNICHNERPLTEECSSNDMVQIGEVYFVENGQMVDRDNWGEKDLFDKGAALRQKISRTGAYVDQPLPLFAKEDGGGSSFLLAMDNTVGNINACIHSTCINSVFFQPGTVALMQDGLVKYYTKYKVSCIKSEEYDGPLPLSRDINIIQPRCLRGKGEDEYWSVKSANEQLHKDRGILRRNLCQVGSSEYLVNMPWCKSNVRGTLHEFTMTTRLSKFPFAVQLNGLDHSPMFLYGEPPLPSAEDDYEAYISTLRGKIDPRFLQENVIDMQTFDVPFKYGRPGGRRRRYSYDLDDGDGGDSPIGQLWEREVDEEMKRVDSLQTKKPSKSKGKKRKVPTSKKADCDK